MENAKITGEVVSPQNIDEMNDEQFEAYIKSAEDGEVQAGETGAAEPAGDAENKPYMSFGTKEELQEYQNQTIGGRLREIREAAERDRENISELCSLAKQRYGVSDDDEAVSMLMGELTEHNAGNVGMSVEQYSLMNELRAIKSEASYQRRVEDIQNEWRRQEKALQNIVPDFSLEKAFENPDFYNSVVERHMTVAEAYPILKRETRSISEIGNLTNGVSGYIKRDVGSMSDREFDEYIKKIKNS